MQTDANHFLAVAQRHLVKVQAAWSTPDWSDLATYELYCLEALVRAAALKNGDKPATNHWTKVEDSKRLHTGNGFPSIETLLHDLNKIRKAEAYGDATFEENDFDAKDMASEI